MDERVEVRTDEAPRGTGAYSQAIRAGDFVFISGQGPLVRLTLNGEALQSSSTAQMVFGVAGLVAFVSRTTTLEPGDLIATGTPPGVGFARTPAIWLRDGDVVSVEVEGIGTLTNPVRAGG